MARKVVVAGVGMAPFGKPGRSESYHAMGVFAARAALEDARVDYRRIQQAYAGYVFGDSVCGQRVFYELGMTGIPVINVTNNCSTGSTALFLARQAVEHGIVDCAMAVGFEQMGAGALDVVFADRPSPMERFVDQVRRLLPDEQAPFAALFFGGAGREYMEKYGVDRTTFAKVATKARRHAAHNPYALFRDPLSVEEVLASPDIFYPLTRLQCCPPTCGAAAAIVCTEEFARKSGLDSRVVVAGQAMTTDRESTFESDSLIRLIGVDMAREAADSVFAQSGVGPEEVDVVELHDCFTANEIVSYEALGLVPEGGAEQFICDEDNTYGGKVVVNPSGGLLSKGHPLGATGLAQCAELVWQLRGEAGPRQVEEARIGLQHNLGLGGACVVTLYQRA